MIIAISDLGIDQDDPRERLYGPLPFKFEFMHGYQLEVLANPYIKDVGSYENLAEVLCRTSGVTGQIASSIGALIYRIEYRNYRRSMMLGPEKRLRGKHNIGEFIENTAISKIRSLYPGVDVEDWFDLGIHIGSGRYESHN